MEFVGPWIAVHVAVLFVAVVRRILSMTAGV